MEREEFELINRQESNRRAVARIIREYEAVELTWRDWRHQRQKQRGHDFVKGKIPPTEEPEYHGN